MPIQSMSAKTIGAIWFGLLASIIAIPFSVAHSLLVNDFDFDEEGYAWLLILFEGVIPVMAAVFFGSLKGAKICREADRLSGRKAFLIGSEIALASAGGWAAISLLFSFFLNRGLESRMVGITLLALFSLPITIPAAVLGAVVLRILVVKQVISAKGQKGGSV